MERVEDGPSMNVVPSMFHAGISNKFTKRHVGNFRDTTLTAASNAKQRAERKLERQADAIEKQQQKIDIEMKKIAEITQNLHRQQLREAKRLRNRLNYAASKIQTAYQRHLTYVNQLKSDAAVSIQTLSRGFLARRLRWRLRMLLTILYTNYAYKSHLTYVAVVWSTPQCGSHNSIRVLNQHRAAIVIQCNTRSFMTRLIYLDVLYLICRIQATMRGYLVRKQLRWLRVSDVDAISKLQAYVRGYLVRIKIQSNTSTDRSGSIAPSSRSNRGQATQEAFVASKRKFEIHNHATKEFRTTRASSFSTRDHDKVGKNGIASLVRSSTGHGWQSTVEPAIKRSYWLPAGASFDKRLPVLPVSKRMKALERVSAVNGYPLEDEFGRINQSWTPKKRPHQKPCPARLSPMAIPPPKSGVCDPCASTADVEEDAILAEMEERLRRQAELKQKLQVRRKHEKRQQEYELKLKREAESEANERKLMEREEKALRLLLKHLGRDGRTSSSTSRTQAKITS
ncbi:Hypothetical protein PHPALM_2509 [Phytophthora palmivora]|uniref:Uncharacterized protein n=1 Tax=Phytophthora palmivora TaxID=4796 RepID=A0A2P4YPS1_9STRA|nr:Hypothetical protein PHPALM_2509 [Phytophthora palmivora]